MVCHEMPPTLSVTVQPSRPAVSNDQEPTALPQQPGDVDRTWADVRRAREDLGWEPGVAIEDGVARFVEWYRERRERSEAGRPATSSGPAKSARLDYRNFHQDQPRKRFGRLLLPPTKTAYLKVGEISAQRYADNLIHSRSNMRGRIHLQSHV